ncbi:MAG: FAD:protein FMN transferase [Verrucomicrobia bacterium]|nr:FAD:protein FMN transferase [Verrucomicrobiota bacterium]
MTWRLHCLAVLVLALPASAAQSKMLAWTGHTMGTTYTVKIAGAAPTDELLAELRAAVEHRFNEINRQMSHYLPDSELSRFNRSTATTPVKVSAELAQVTRRALKLARDSKGAFDPTMEPLVNLWGFGPQKHTGETPADAQILAAKRRCGARHVRVTAGNELQKSIPELQLNLGAIGKGYAADEAARLLRERGHTNLFVSVSGEIVALGVRPDGRPWQVGVERPHYSRTRNAELIAVVPLSGRALSTSGDTHQFFRDSNGRVRSHILDPSTGRPVEHHLASVTVIAPDALTADGAATTLFVLGLERGLRWVEERPELAALFVIRNGTEPFRLVPSRRFPPNLMKGKKHHATPN